MKTPDDITTEATKGEERVVGAGRYCGATRVNGLPCKGAALRGKGLCRHHDAVELRRFKAADRESVSALTIPALIRLDVRKSDSLMQFRAGLMAHVARGTIGVREALAMHQLACAIRDDAPKEKQGPSGFASALSKIFEAPPPDPGADSERPGGQPARSPEVGPSMDPATVSARLPPAPPTSATSSGTPPYSSQPDEQARPGVEGENREGEEDGKGPVASTNPSLEPSPSELYRSIRGFRNSYLEDEIALPNSNEAKWGSLAGVLGGTPPRTMGSE